MNLEQIFVLMSIVGTFGFISSGIIVTNSIEAHNSEILSNILSFICFICFIITIIGFIGFGFYG